MLRLIETPAEAAKLEVDFGAKGKFLHSEVLALIAMMRRCIKERKWRAARQAHEAIEERMKVLDFVGRNGLIKTREEALRDNQNGVMF
jgi:hypothetical protein